MCRNIRVLYNFEPPATDEEIRASARLLDSLVTTAAPKDREEEAAKARARAVARFGS